MIWIVGSGLMAKEYAKVLTALGETFMVIGRGEANAAEIAKEYNCNVVSGGLEHFLATRPSLPAKAINATGIEALATTTGELIRYGIKDILVEKPGIGYPSEIEPLSTLAESSNANVLLAYNRRFYTSVLEAEKIIDADGGVRSFCFEFTEWSHVIRGLKKTAAEHHNWFLGNSSHVIDTAFFLAGKPRELCAFHRGGSDWHPSGTIFAGAGVSEKNALFSYHADWEAPGRWVMEILTAKSRLLFKPMETLQLQKIGSVAVEPVALEDHLDKDFKPGLFLQTKAFVGGDYARFCTIAQQKEMIDKYYLKMSGYQK